MSIPGRADADIEQTFTHAGSEMQLLVSPDFEPSMRSNISEWIDFVSASLALVYGEWPRARWQVSVRPAASAASDPIPWAQVHRENTDRVEFFIAPRATVAELKSAWTGYHELAHLLIPYRGWGDTWFSEGLASYYQNILQARAGMLDEQQMWQRLHEGLERGRNDSAFDAQTLAEVSDNMRKDGGFMRVYWTGAWYFLAVDIRLRRQSGGSSNLDLALARLNRCCATKHLSASEIARELDSVNKVVLFQPLYASTRELYQVPATESLFASLGITVQDGRVTLQEEGPGASLRRQIFNPAAL